MNRTSFGALFAAMDAAVQSSVIRALLPLEKEGYASRRISEKAGTVGELYEFLKALGERRKNEDDDPTYRANTEGEKLSISALGATFNENSWPVFEFRGCGCVFQSALPDYVEYVLKELNRRESSVLNFSTNKVLWKK